MAFHGARGLLKGPLLTWHRGFWNPFESGLQSLEERTDLVTGGVWRRRGLSLSQAAQAEQHRHQQARGAHGTGHPASSGSKESTREWQEEPERSRVSASLAIALQSKRQAATQPLQKFPRSYLGAGRGREQLGGAGRPGAEPCGRGEEGRGGARRGEASRAAWRTAWGRVAAGLRDAGRGEKLSRETGFTKVAGKPWRERHEKRLRSLCGGSQQSCPATRSPLFYTGRSGITTAEGLQAQAR